MRYSKEAPNNTPNSQHGDIQYVCEHIKADINTILNETKHLHNGERFKKLHRLHELQQILSTIEDIAHSVDDLLKKELQKRSSESH